MPSPSTAPARLLLVEDDDDLAETLIPALEDHGFEVRRSADGLEGFDLARSHVWSAVILDLMLPTVPGAEVIRRLREVSEVPVLVLTARHGLTDRVGRLDDGADDYLTKPFELPELVARLRVLIRRSAGSASRSLRLGDLDVDLYARSVARGGRLVELSATEYRLLELLVRSRGSSRTAEDIALVLSASGDPIATTTVRIHVRNLRAKLGEELIQTRRGYGYFIAGSDG
jgi:DNA-binding response OmpR family regulator